MTGAPANDMDTSSASPPLNPANKITDSHADLRFPRAVVDLRIRDLVQRNISRNMTLMHGIHSEGSNRDNDDGTRRSRSDSDEGSLEDSTYEMIDSDGESQNDATTESIASTDYGRPDDIASLADTEGSEEDSEAEDDDHESIPAYDGLDGPSETPTIGRSATSFLSGLATPLVRSIEFAEPIDLGAESVSVKHTIADFSEERSARIVEDMKLVGQPKHLMASIQQTMTRMGLSTKEPLRILYVGSHSAKQEIIRKIGSSVAASVKGASDSARRASSQLYNVVPVSAFGSEDTPDVELMHSSGYQIQVEECKNAVIEKNALDTEGRETIKISTEDGTVKSLPSGSKFMLDPSDAILPHVAIIYCSENDTPSIRHDQIHTRTFMSRHGVPCIVISHKQCFDRSARPLALDQHAIHMCLESRDSHGARNVIHQRLPIDLTSFLNIDARQMNRNLAYLTGLHDRSDVTGSQLGDSPNMQEKHTERKSLSLRAIVERNLTLAGLLKVLILIAITAVSSIGLPQLMTAKQPCMSINGSSGIQSTILATTSSSVPSVILSTSTPLTTKTLSRTSTKTVTVTPSTVPGPNSLAPFIDLKNLLGESTNGNKSLPCSAEIIENHKILLRIPSAIKSSWLKKGDLTVNITRAQQPLTAEQVYISEEGIVLELLKSQAWGRMEVGVHTTKKPKIQQKFVVDFGLGVDSILQQVIRAVRKDVLDTEAFARQITSEVDEHVRKLIGHVRETDLPDLEGLREQILKHAVGSAMQFVDAAKGTTNTLYEHSSAVKQHIVGSAMELVDAAKGTTNTLYEHSGALKQHISDQISQLSWSVSNVAHKVHTSTALKEVQNKASQTILRAQIASRLKWMRWIGDEKGSEEYRLRAERASNHMDKSRAKKGGRVLKNPSRKASKKGPRRDANGEKAQRESRRWGL
jgi:hypothetical protein